MTTELIDNEFIVDDGTHPFERLGFKMVKNDESRIWVGRSNMYIESKSFQKKDSQLGEWCIKLEIRRGETGRNSFSRISGNIILLPKLSDRVGLIKSKRRFWLFRKPKNKIEEFYSIQPPINSIDLIGLLLELRENSIDIKAENGIIKFQFNFDTFENYYYELIIDVLCLVPGW